jgi:hypothetical protein
MWKLVSYKKVQKKAQKSESHYALIPKLTRPLLGRGNKSGGGKEG